MDLLQDLALARFTVDRAAALRNNPHWLEDAWDSPHTRIVLVNDGRVPVTDDFSLILIAPEAFAVSVDDVREATFLLGIDDDHTYIGLLGYKDHLGEAAWVTLRDVGSHFEARDVGLAVTATALASWHHTHQYCPRCGAQTVISAAGWSRTCSADDTTHFPRTEPAMIVAVEDVQGRLLLGRRAEWPESWFSTLAGFVEAGESAETAVAREVFEESGVHIDLMSLRYLGSQPWPYPASLMLGYRAVATTTDIAIQDAEMIEARWFTHDEFERACEARTLQLPNPASIAWRLIEHWFGTTMPREWSRA